jgi:hypothetical protein
MNAIHILGSAALLFLAGCTAPPSADGKKDKDHLLHHPSAALSPGTTKQDQQMAQMREMHRKMMAAKTPQERQALMADHMKAMQGGMSMMCQMGATPTPQAGAPSEDTTKRCMAMKDMTMQMMQDREKLQSPVR